MDIAFEMGSYGIRVPLKPLLRLALMQGNVELVRKYLADGGDVEARDQKGRSPLMIAAARGSLELCSLLLDHGASVDSVDANGASASDLATAASHHHVLDLLRSGVEPNGVADIHVDWPIDDESSGWEAYEEDTAPEDDAALREAVSQTQSVLERHRFVHPDKDWSALALELPDVTEIEAKRRLFDEQGRADFLQILHTSSMYANVPVRRIEELANEIESSPRGGLFERLSLVLGDLGCILDYSEEDWMLARDASEICAADEELLELSEQFLVDLASLRNDPFAQHSRDLSRSEILDRDGERQIGRMIEAAIRSACQSIAGSEAAANAVLALGDAVRHGEVSVGSISRIDYSDLDAGSGSVEGEPESTESAAVELAESEESAKTKEAFLLAVSSFESSLSRCGVGKSKQSNSILFDSVLDLRLTMGGVRAVNAILGASSTDCDALVSSLHKLRVLEEEMVESNIRLVAFVAKKYAFKGCPRMELIQEGILGLIRAIEKFDFARGTKFSTYAIWWIRQSITRYLADKTRTIRVPVHMVEKINKLDAVARAAGAESAAELSIEYLADRSGLTIPEVRKALSVVGEPLSFSDSDEVLRQVEGISDPDQTPEESAVQADLARSVRRCLAELSEREAAVIAHRFGLKDGNEWTLEEVGAVFDVTRERIRQIEASALKKLRHPNRRALLGRAINDLDEAED